MSEKGTHTIFRLYFGADDGGAFDLVNDPPPPWQTNGPEPCRVALNTNEFEDAWSVVCHAERQDLDGSEKELEDSLLRWLRERGVRGYIVQDISKIRAEKDRLDKIKRGVSKQQAQR